MKGERRSLVVLTFAALSCVLATVTIHAAKVETFAVHSTAMDKDIPVAAILPDNYNQSRKYPVVYMLHGAGSDYKTWTMADAQFLCDRYGFVGICPDGGKTSWWWDAPVDPTYRYETFVIAEAIPFVERKYSIDARRERRAILGGSMGGHGACWLGFRHKELFGAVGSIFGGVDVRPFPEKWDVAKRLGPLQGNEDVWTAHCAVTEAAKLVNGDVDLCMMIGTRDFFLKVNRDMHDLLAKNGVEHTYIEYTTESPRTSGHCREFTTYAMPVMFKFFDNYFRTGSGQLATGCRPHVGAAMIRAREESSRSPLVLFMAMTGKPDAKEAKEYIESAQKAGFGQIMIYPRTGLEWDYMGEEWLSFVDACLKEVKSRSMKAWLYDEYNWPSGSCKGRVVEENPEWSYSEYGVWRNDDGSFRWDVKDFQEKNTYANCHDREAVRRFIDLTHKVYETRFSSYMKDGTIPGIFTDEPATKGWILWKELNYAKTDPLVGFRWYKDLERQYRERTGRDFRTDVEAALDDPSKTEVWETYTELRGRQFRSAYFDQIREWSDKVGIKTCGHLMAESNPIQACRGNGLPLQALCGMSLPGMDNVFFEIENTREWLTYSTAQYAIEHNSTPGRTVLDAHGGIELFGLGPCDISMVQMAQRIWLAALYGMDTYFMSLYHTTAKGFLEKPKSCYAMFTSPTQPWFSHCGDLHDAARKAAKWSRKKFLRDVAVRYPQRVFGRIALGAATLAPNEKIPPLKELVSEFAWNQVSFELLQDDEKSDLPFVFSFSRDGRIVEEKSGKAFATPAETLAWLRGERNVVWRVTDEKGAVVPGVLVRRYADGTAAVLNMTERDMPELTLEKGTSERVCFALPPCGTRLFANDEKGWMPKKVIGDVATRGWTLSRDRDSLRRIWFSSNNVARLVVTTPINGVRWLLCDYPKDGVKVSLDGKPIVANMPCTSAPYGYAPIYRETPPMEIAEGTHELVLEGRSDENMFLPVLWLAGDFAAEEPNSVFPSKKEIAHLAPLADLGFQDFAGVATYRATVNVPKEAGVVLALDTGGLPACVRLGGRDLGEKVLPPLEWNIPPELAGRELPLEVEVATSIRPIFGRDDMLDVSFYKPPYWQNLLTQVNAARSGLSSAKWKTSLQK